MKQQVFMRLKWFKRLWLKRGACVFRGAPSKRSPIEDTGKTSKTEPLESPVGQFLLGFLALVEVVGDFRGRIRTQHVQLL